MYMGLLSMVAIQILLFYSSDNIHKKFLWSNSIFQNGPLGGVIYPRISRDELKVLHRLMKLFVGTRR